MQSTHQQNPNHSTSTVEPRYNKDLRTMKLPCHIRFFLISGFKKINIKSWDQQNYLVRRGFVINIYNKVLLYNKISQTIQLFIAISQMIFKNKICIYRFSVFFIYLFFTNGYIYILKVTCTGVGLWLYASKYPLYRRNVWKIDKRNNTIV